MKTPLEAAFDELMNYCRVLQVQTESPPRRFTGDYRSWGRLTSESAEAHAKRMQQWEEDRRSLEGIERRLATRTGGDFTAGRFSNDQAQLAQIEWRLLESQHPDLFDLRHAFGNQEYRYGVVLPTTDEMRVLMKIADRDRLAARGELTLALALYVVIASVIVAAFAAVPMNRSLTLAGTAITGMIFVAVAVSKLVEYAVQRSSLLAATYVVNFARTAVMRLGMVLRRELQETQSADGSDGVDIPERLS